MAQITHAIALLAALTACAVSDDALDGLPQGTQVDAGGKADGDLQVVFSTASSAGALAYPDPDADADAPWTQPELEAIFGTRLTPSGTAGAPWNALRRGGPLGYYGPLGPYGPLGVFGPVGENLWNPSLLVSGGIPWNALAEEITDAGGPLGPDGPLGHRGPLEQDAWRSFEAAWSASHPDTVHAVHLRPGGVFSMLGPTGPLGALGPLGPLGPVGAHGFARVDGGDYAPEDDACTLAPEGSDDPPCRAVELDTGHDERRVYDLVEFYTEDHAAALPDNDASFVVQGSIMPGEASDRFVWSSDRDQWVAVLVLPEFAKFPPFQAVFDLPDAGASLCIAGEDHPGCAPGAIAYQLLTPSCLAESSAAVLDRIEDSADEADDADSLEAFVDAIAGVTALDAVSRCAPRIPDTIFVRHALYPWRTQVVGAQFNPLVCNPGTFLLNPWCRATGLDDVHAVAYDHRAAFDDFDLELELDTGDGRRASIVSSSADVLDWVHVRVPAGTALRASVTLAGIWEVTDEDREWGLDLFIESGEWADALSASDIEFFGSGSRRRPVPRYRLVVVGGTEHTDASDVAFGGPHLAEVE
jgi:hypothetical protein